MTRQEAKDYLMRVLNTSKGKGEAESSSIRGKPRATHEHSGAVNGGENSFQISEVHGSVVINYNFSLAQPLHEILSRIDGLDPPLSETQSDQIREIIRHFKQESD